MLDLMPSSASVMFCSEECCKETHKKFNGKDELIRDSLRGNDIRQKMMRIMNESLNATRGFDDLQSIFESLKSETLFDFDFSDSNEVARKTLICIASLMPKTDQKIIEHVKGNLNIPNGPKKDFFITFLSRIILNYMRNGVKVPSLKSNLPEGGMLLPYVSLMNHSCDPNTYSTFIDNKCFIFVIKPIAAGEQVYNTYR
jgi:SET and MYND domain-containing protein 4